MDPALVACVSLAEGDRRGLAAAASAVAVAAALRWSERRREEDVLAPLILDLRERPRPARGSILAAPAAKRTERLVQAEEDLRAAARGRVCVATPAWLDRDGRLEPPLPDPDSADLDPRLSLLADLVHGEAGIPAVFCLCEQRHFRACIELGLTRARAALVHAGVGDRRALLSLLCHDLLAEGVPVKVWNRPIGLVQGRRALAGLEAGHGVGRRAERFATALCRLPSQRVDRRPSAEPLRPAAARGERGQALPAVLGLSLLVVIVALALAAIGGAATAKGRLQRTVDLAAISAARSMHDDFARLFQPSHLPNGTPNPAHLPKSEYLARAREAATVAIERNGGEGRGEVEFPDAASFAPMRVRVRLGGEIEIAGAGTGARTDAVAVAELAPQAAGGSEGVAMASGGGYAGPLAYRQGKPMRPDVAAAFDRMSAVARADGHSLIVNSAFRSDAEQRRLWNANPDPRWVAPPGTSLHRCGTELDLGPPSAYGWLAANASRFGFVKRYAWEPWHFGYDRGPKPCSAEADRLGRRASADGKRGGSQGLPSFVPARYRAPILAAAARHNVSASLLAAQLMAESNFNPAAVSSAGAQGIAQFMPATAAAYGLDDPFDPIASIAAQARMMSDLLRQFGSVELALAAYNAGPGAVSSCACVPPYPETQAYVAKILGLLDGAGELAAPGPVLEVRLVD